MESSGVQFRGNEDCVSAALVPGAERAWRFFRGLSPSGDIGLVWNDRASYQDYRMRQ